MCVYVYVFEYLFLCAYACLCVCGVHNSLCLFKRMTVCFCKFSCFFDELVCVRDLMFSFVFNVRVVVFLCVCV